MGVAVRVMAGAIVAAENEDEIDEKQVAAVPVAPRPCAAVVVVVVVVVVMLEAMVALR